MRRNILILGGTSDARELADALSADPELRVTTSLAGRTAKPAMPSGNVRTGGFGGPSGLAAYLTDKGVDLLIDATHPYAAQMSHNASKASAVAAVPCFRVERPAWVAKDSESWIRAKDHVAAAAALPAGARALVTIGRQQIEPFLSRLDITVLARMIERPEDKPLAPHRIMLARPPFALEDEILLLRTEHMSHLVTKNAGGEITAPKLEAARQLGVEIVMIDRPDLPELETARSVEQALALAGRMLE